MAKAKTPKQLMGHIRSLKSQIATAERNLKKARAKKAKKPKKKVAKKKSTRKKKR